MLPQLKKRFWTDVTTEQIDEGHVVLLDARALSTPAKSKLILPNAASAQMVAQEWDAVEDEIDPTIMRATRAANAAIDKVGLQFNEVVAMLAAYGESDLLCYRADEPNALVARQIEHWDPILAWAQQELDAPMAVTSGVIPVGQEPKSLARLGQELERQNAFELTASHDLITISGSLILSLAVIRGHLSAQAAWNLSRLDENWQIELWGEDELAQEAAEKKRQDFEFAAKFYEILQEIS